MSNIIDQLNNDGREENRGPQLQTAFIPSLEQGETNENDYPNKQPMMSMTSGNPTERVKADLSSLPKDENETIGVDVRESLTKDILGPNGPFQDYLKEKTKQAQEFVAEMELEQEISGGMDNSGEGVETNLASDDKVINPNDTYKEIDIFEQHEEIKMEEVKTEKVEINEYEEDVNDTDKEVTVGLNEDDLELSTDFVRYEEDFDDEEIEDDDVVVDESTEQELSDKEKEKNLQIIKSMVTDKIKPVSKKLDISGFTVAKKGIASNTVLDTGKEVPVAKWVLPSTGISFRMREISGSNLEKLRFALSNSDVRTSLQIIYNHIVSSKPQTLEAWAKSIAFDDYDHLFMGIYIASFSDSNYIPIDCKHNGCKKTYITENIPMFDMVRFKDDESKAKFMDIYKSEPSNPEGLYSTSIVPISDNYAFGFKEPSIYNVLIENEYVDSEFARKYNNVVTALSYIDNIYYINKNTKELQPIEWKIYTNNIAKTIKAKIVRYDKIFSTMSADEIAVISAYIDAINQRGETVTYRIPDTTCQHCNKVNKFDQDQSASALVFLRNQLGRLVNI